MANYRAELEVARPIDEAFAYLADFANTEQWDPGVVRADRLTPGPIGTGTAFEVVSDFLGREVPLTYRIVQYEAPTRLMLEAENETLRSVDTVTFEKTPSGTRLVYEANLTLKGLRYLADLALHVAFQIVGRRALGGLETALARN